MEGKTPKESKTRSRPIQVKSHLSMDATNVRSSRYRLREGRIHESGNIKGKGRRRRDENSKAETCEIEGMASFFALSLGEGLKWSLSYIDL